MTIFSSKLALIIFSFLLLTTSSFALSPLQSFTQCFLDKTLNSSQILFTPDSASYQSILLSSVQNPRFLVSSSYRKPAAIVTATAESHVSASVACARAQGLQLRARSGGHDYEAMSYVSEFEQYMLREFVVLDLQFLRKIDVDAGSRTAWVQAGATIGEVYYNVFTRTNGSAGFPAGTCPTVGVGGHISGAGIGTISRKFGTAADNVIDARIVGVDGRVLDRNGMGEELFWAIRGGGAASFGVVVAYRIKLVDVPPVMTVFIVERNLRQNATRLVTRWQQIAPKLDDNLYIRVIAQPTTDGGNPSIRAQFKAVFLGNQSELFSVMAASFPELGLLAEDCTEMSWLESALFISGMLNKGGAALLNRAPQSNSSFKAKSDIVMAPIAESEWERIWEFLMAGVRDQPAMIMIVILEPLGGRMEDISPSATPFPYRRGVLYVLQYFMRWFGTDVGATERHLDWMRELYEFMEPYVSENPRGAYYNYKDIDLSRNESARVWGEKYFMGNFKRLAYVKGKVDPENFFRNEQSILPLVV